MINRKMEITKEDTMKVCWNSLKVFEHFGSEQNNKLSNALVCLFIYKK